MHIVHVFITCTSCLLSIACLHAISLHAATFLKHTHLGKDAVQRHIMRLRKKFLPLLLKRNSKKHRRTIGQVSIVIPAPIANPVPLFIKRQHWAYNKIGFTRFACGLWYAVGAELQMAIIHTGKHGTLTGNPWQQHSLLVAHGMRHQFRKIHFTACGHVTKNRFGFLIFFTVYYSTANRF